MLNAAYQLPRQRWASGATYLQTRLVSVSVVGSGVNLGELLPKGACSQGPPLPHGPSSLTLSVTAFATIIGGMRLLSN